MAIEKNGIPAHVAVIMDGNGRWATQRMLSKKAGHKAGAQALKKIAGEASGLGVEILTAYAFSTENWKRPPKEIDALMDLMGDYIQQYIDDKDKNDMRLIVVGRRERLAGSLAERVSYLERITKEKKGMRLVIALDYGARDEITRAAQNIAQAALLRDLRPKDITEELLSEHLDTASLPDPELLIRTGGEYRLSNFLLWQSAYTELFFTDKLWPDFKPDDFRNAIDWFRYRERRFGGRPEKT